MPGLKDPHRKQSQFDLERGFGIKPNPAGYDVTCKFH